MIDRLAYSTIVLLVIAGTLPTSGCGNDKSAESDTDTAFVQDGTEVSDGGTDNEKPDEIIGVIFVTHGGMATFTNQSLWDAAVHMFTYDPNHAMYKLVIWEPDFWKEVLDQNYSDWTTRFLRKFSFEYPRMGGTDPAYDIIEAQKLALEEELKKQNTNAKLAFEIDYADWMSGEHPDRYPYPRFLYFGPDGPNAGHNLTYCGEDEPEGKWDNCDPDRYNVDGPAERLIKKGASKIAIVDITVGGIRFGKSHDVVRMIKRAIDAYNKENKTSIPDPIWINDPTNLLERSYPTEPANWTRSAKEPITDPKVPLEGSPSPISEDMELAELHANGIDSSFSQSVDDAKTGVLLFNHPLHDFNEYFDPKINDTILLNKNIKSVLIERHLSIDPANIVGAFGGIKIENPANGLVERMREMRAQTLGEAWLYETEKEMPAGEWGYRYWEALEYLKGRGVQHIVVAFPQIVTSSALDVIEIYCQIGVEIGTHTWARWDTGDFETYPEVGHPFPDYWGPWVDPMCGPDEYSQEQYECCFEMGGCEDGRPFPPPRQTPLSTKREGLDPSLAFDMSEYGQLGYNPELGPPDPNNPVQEQYTGTWEVWKPINKDPHLGKILARHVLEVLENLETQ